MKHMAKDVEEEDFMEHTSNTREKGTPIQNIKTDTHKSRAASQARIVALIHGMIFTGAACVLGTCALPFGALPFGFALLCASQSTAWYVWFGLCLSALHPAFPLPFWGGWLVYTLTMLFRMMFGVLWAQDTGKAVKKKVASPSALAWFQSFNEKLWVTDRDVPTDTSTDYYRGKRNSPAKIETVDEEQETPSSEKPAASVLLPEEPLPLRMLSAALGGFALGLWLMIAGGFAVYDLLGFLVVILLSPLFTYLLMPCFSKEGQDLLFSGGASDVPPRRGHTYWLEHFSAPVICSGLLLLFLCILASRAYVLSSFSPYVTLRLAPTLALLLTVRFTASKGLIPGLMVAIICGLAADPMLSPAFILASLTYGVLRFLSRHAAVIGSCILALLWVTLGGGIQQTVTYLPSFLLSIPLCFVMQKLSVQFPAATESKNRDAAMNDFAYAMEQKTRAEAHRSRLEALSGAFTSLSKMFYDLSGQLRKPKLPELRRLCDEVFDRHCARCRYRETCDKAACHPADLLAPRLAAQLYKKGSADLHALPPEAVADCFHIQAILEDINSRCAKLTEHLIKSEKTEVFAADYESVADLIKDTLEDEEEEYRCNRQAADKIFDWLTARGVTVQGVVVCGKRHCRIIVKGTHFDQSEPALRELRTCFEDICATRLSLPSFEEEENTSSTVMHMASTAIYDTVYAGSTVPADTPQEAPLPPPLTNENSHSGYMPPSTCGDHIALFKSDNACFYALISDGMGSGAEASLTSDICALFLEKMLSAGNRVELSVRMLNSLIRQKNSGTGDECSATVDLMELDLMSGQAIFAKSGASPTYVVRGGKVYKLRSRTLPIGILKDSDPQLLRFRMHPGDVVVMVSDGVTGGNDECPWLIDLLSDPLPESMNHLRLKILRQAIASGSPDDLSAIAVRVEESTSP